MAKEKIVARLSPNFFSHWPRSISPSVFSGKSRGLNGDPMLHGKPFMAGAWIHIFGGIHGSCLKFILKLRMVDRKWKGEIDGLFVAYLVLFNVFDKLDLLFMLE